MNILILGATGFVGSTLTRLLLDEGVHVTCAGRDIEAIKKQFPQAKPLFCDFLKDVTSDTWLPRLERIDAIVNCVGIFFNKDKNILWNIHYHAPKALYEAAQLSNIKQIIHVSALGIEHYDNEYAKSKLAIEAFLKTISIPHIIIKPSVIYGQISRGSIGMLKILASCPGLIPLPGKGEQVFQPVYVGDLSRAIKNLLLMPPAHTSLTLTAASEQKSTLKDMLISIRRWLKLKKGFFISIPFSFIKLAGWLGDTFSLTVINKQAVEMLQAGNYSSIQETKFFQETTRVVPLNFSAGLNQNPVTQEEKWYIRLVLLHPFLKISLAIMWVFSAVTSILPYAKSSSYALLNHIGINSLFQPILLYGAASLNALIGFCLLINFKTKINCVIQLLVILLYTLIITIYLPYLWLEPFGPVVKNIPILIGICTLYILES